MGVNLKDLVNPGIIQLADLSLKKIGIDAFNWLYQFLSIIRQPDGTPLMDNKGRVTSHLTGLFYRTANLLEANVMPCYVFDGKPPEFKQVSAERSARKKKARVKYEQALSTGDLEKAHSYATQTSRLTPEMVIEAKQLLSAMGVPFIQAPSEGEAQTAFMVKKGDFYASASQDYDTLLFGSPRLVRNLNVTGRRKVPRKQEWVFINPEMIELKSVLEQLGLSQDQLIILGVLVGTDFNPGGVKGVGPKTALKLVREHNDLSVFDHVDWSFKIKPEQIIDFFKKPPVIKEYKLSWSELDPEAVRKVLLDHDFSESRIDNTINRIKKAKESGGQSNLKKWF